jgi:hypothetical protein
LGHERRAARKEKRSEAARLGWERRRARAALPKLAEQHKRIESKKASVAKKRASRKGRPANTDVYSREERERDRAELERLRGENEALRAQVESVIDTSGWVNILDPEWIREDGSIALNRCRLRHTPDAPRIQEILEEAYAIGGRAGVKRVVENLAEHYEDRGDYPDDDPMTEHEIWTLFFSP